MDDGLSGGRQPIRPWMQLPLEPAVAAERLVFGDGRLVHAPRHAVDERDVGGGQRRGLGRDVSGRRGACRRRTCRRRTWWTWIWRRGFGRRRAWRGGRGTWRCGRLWRLRGLRRGCWCLRRGSLWALRRRGLRRKREGGEKNRQSDEGRHRVHRCQSTTNDVAL